MNFRLPSLPSSSILRCSFNTCVPSSKSNSFNWLPGTDYRVQSLEYCWRRICSSRRLSLELSIQNNWRRSKLLLSDRAVLLRETQARRIWSTRKLERGNCHGALRITYSDWEQRSWTTVDMASGRNWLREQKSDLASSVVAFRTVVFVALLLVTFITVANSGGDGRGGRWNDGELALSRRNGTYIDVNLPFLVAPQYAQESWFTVKGVLHASLHILAWALQTTSRSLTEAS